MSRRPNVGVIGEHLVVAAEVLHAGSDDRAQVCVICCWKSP